LQKGSGIVLTDEDIEKIEKELGKEKFQELVNYVAKGNILELKEIARKKVQNKFVKVLRRYNSKYISNLYCDKTLKKETINSLNQANMSLRNVHKLIKNKSIVDANTLLRACFENLIMGMMIYYDENVYNEFIDLSIDDKTRTFTKPQKLRNEFRKVLRLVDKDFFNDFSNKELKKMLDEFYDKLCFFTHSTLIVNAMVELCKENCISMYVFALKQNAYFVEILLYFCLKYLNKSTCEPIDITCMLIGWFIILSDINKEDIANENINMIKELLYININTDYLDKNKDIIELVTNEFKELQETIASNPIGVINILKEIIK
jgi:hypothetical protein